MGTIVHRTVTNEIAVHGTRLAGYLDGQKLLDDTRATPVSVKWGSGRRPTASPSPRRLATTPRSLGDSA